MSENPPSMKDMGVDGKRDNSSETPDPSMNKFSFRDVLQGKVKIDTKGIFRKILGDPDTPRNLDDRKIQHRFEQSRTKLFSLDPHRKYEGMRKVFQYLQRPENLHTKYLREEFFSISQTIMDNGSTGNIRELFNQVQQMSLSEDSEIRSVGAPILPFFLRTDNLNLSIVRKEAFEVFQKSIAMLGLDYQTTTRAWLDSFSGKVDQTQEEHVKDFLYYMSSNLRVATGIEAKQKGICKLLSEQFGILDFGRYPEELLLAQYEQRDQNIPYGTIAFPREDHNGAFYAQYRVFQNLIPQLQGKMGLRVIEANNPRDLIHKFAMLNKRYGKNETGYKVSFGIMGAHGSEDGVTIGSPEAKTRTYHYIEEFVLGLPYTQSTTKRRTNKQRPLDTRISLADLKRSATSGILETFFEDDATLILISCLAGKDEQLPRTIIPDPRPRPYDRNRSRRRIFPTVYTKFQTKPRTFPGKKFFAQTLGEQVREKRLNIIASATSTNVKAINVEFADGNPKFLVKYYEEGADRNFASVPNN